MDPYTAFHPSFIAHTQEQEKMLVPGLGPPPQGSPQCDGYHSCHLRARGTRKPESWEEANVSRRTYISSLTAMLVSRMNFLEPCAVTGELFSLPLPPPFYASTYVTPSLSLASALVPPSRRVT